MTDETRGYRRTRLHVSVSVNNTDATGSTAEIVLKFVRRSGEPLEDFVKRVRSSVSAAVTRACREIGGRTDS